MTNWLERALPDWRELVLDAHKMHDGDRARAAMDAWRKVERLLPDSRDPLRQRLMVALASRAPVGDRLSNLAKFALAFRNLATHTEYKPESGLAFAQVIICSELYGILAGVSPGLPSPDSLIRRNRFGLPFDDLVLHAREHSLLSTITARVILDDASWGDYLRQHGLSAGLFRERPEYKTLAEAWRVACTSEQSCSKLEEFLIAWTRANRDPSLDSPPAAVARFPAWGAHRQFWSDMAAGVIPSMADAVAWRRSTLGRMRWNETFDVFAFAAGALFVLVAEFSIVGSLIGDDIEKDKPSWPFILAVMLPIPLLLWLLSRRAAARQGELSALMAGRTEIPSSIKRT